MQLNPDLVRIRRHLHQLAEVSGGEFQTADLVFSLIREWSPKPDFLLSELGGTGILAAIEGKLPGRTILFRAELDALPIHEINDLDYRSVTEGVSHKCGHDGHMAILLGLFAHICQCPPAAGRILFLFQPAEETGRGARAVLADPRFADIRPDFVFALHNLPGSKLGNVVLKSGPITASVRSLIIRLGGKTAHAAEPENGVSPALAIAEILQLAASRTNPEATSSDFFLLTPVFLSMGEKAYGVAAGKGEVHFTIRAWTEVFLQERIGLFLRELTELADRHNLSLEFGWTDSFVANENNQKAVDVVETAARQLGLAIERPRLPLKWGEDFGAFTQLFPGAFIGLGAGVNCPALHRPDYDFPDELIPVGTDLLRRIADLITSHSSHDL